MRTRLKKQPKFVRGKTYLSILIVILFASLFVIPLYYVQQGLKTLQRNSVVYAQTAPKEFKMPELAPEPEKTRNTKLIQMIFGKDSEQAIRVFTCESGLRSDAMNTQNSDGFVDVGVAQIHLTDKSPFSVDEMKNPVANLYRAKDMFNHRGWQPWDSSASCWNK